MNRPQSNDTLSLSDWYINSHKIQLIKATQDRFAYLFMDETQDTNKKQYELISTIFDNNADGVIIQKFGDPYQALYNLFNNEDDSWVPIDENSIQIAKSNRFGFSIAKVLRTTCVHKYDILEGNPEVSSFSPYLMLFSDSNKDQVLSHYASIINGLQKKNHQFKDSIKKIYAISRLHDELLEFNDGYLKKAHVTVYSKPLLKQVLDHVIHFLVRILREKGYVNAGSGYFNSQTLTSFLQSSLSKEYQLLRVNLTKWLSVLNNSERIEEELQQVTEELNKLIGLIYQEICTEELGDFYDEGIIALCRKIIVTINAQSTVKDLPEANKVVIEGVPIHLDTIHAVKGETHKATLLLESDKFMEREISEEYGSDLNSIFNFLIGEFDESKVENREIKNYLKLAYVGLSRPTHFAGVAMNKKHIDNIDEKIKKAKEKGWIVIEI